MEATVVNRTIIRYVKAFSMLSDAECDALLLGVTERRLNANEVLFRQGDPGEEGDRPASQGVHFPGMDAIGDAVSHCRAIAEDRAEIEQSCG